MRFSRFFSPLFLTISLVTVSCSSVEKIYAENTDQYWSQLVKTSEQKKISILEVLKKENLHLYNQIEADAQDLLVLDFWGKSLNFDSGAKKQIISDAIISDLQKKFKLSNDNKVVHAGVTHTYGYLFSVLDTPYGTKRKRWIEPTLNYGFGFQGNGLSPETMQGSLLSNVTYFAGKLGFRDEERKQQLDQLKNVSPEVRNFDYKKVARTVLEEEVAATPITLRTTLVKLPFKQPQEESDYLLIYTVLNQKEKQSEKREVLITAFPIKKDAYAKTVDPSGLGKNQPVVVRYNAYVEGLMEQKWTGVRKILDKVD